MKTNKGNGILVNNDESCNHPLSEQEEKEEVCWESKTKWFSGRQLDNSVAFISDLLSLTQCQGEEMT